MRSTLTIGKYFGRPHYIDTPSANFRSHQSGAVVPDGGLMTVIASALYLKRSGDVAYLKKHFTALRRAMAWYEKRNNGGLIREGFLCEWADAVLKSGSTLYTNVLYAKALSDMADMADRLGYEDAKSAYARQHKIIVTLLKQTLWNGTYFSDWHDYKRQDYFPSHANFLAVLFDVADKNEADSILSYAKKHTQASFTMETNYPEYPWWRIPVIQFVSGVKDYHNRGCMWLQPGITYTVALWKSGKKQEARTFIARIAHQIIRHNTVFEVYEKNGNPLRRFLYRSEGPFAWSAGLFLWAASIVR
jgi:uncharacterized protein (DUF608 family)